MRHALVCTKKFAVLVLCLGLPLQGFSGIPKRSTSEKDALAAPAGSDTAMQEALQDEDLSELKNAISEKNYTDLLTIFGKNEELLKEYIGKCVEKKEMDESTVLIGAFSDIMRPSDFDTDIEKNKQPLILAFGGGTGLLASIKPLHKLGARVRSVQCSVDDGGSTNRIINDFIKSGMGRFPSLGDLMSSLFKGFATEDKLYKLLDDLGRVALDKETGGITYKKEDGTMDTCDSLRELVVKLLRRNVEYTVGNGIGIGYAEKTTVLSDDFVYFATSILNLIDNVEKKFITIEEPLVQLKGASIRNIPLISAIDRAGFLDIDNPIFKDADDDKKRTPLLDNEEKGRLFQKLLDKLGEIADIKNGRVSLSHNEPQTIYCMHIDNVIIVEDIDSGGKTDLHAIAVRKIIEHDKTRFEVRVPERNYELHKLYWPDQVHKIKIGSLTISVKIDADKNFAFAINNSDEYATLNETDAVEDSCVKYLGVDHRMATNGTGMVRFEEEKEDEIYRTYRPLILGGKKVYIRSRLTAMQTHITETVNRSKIIDFGLVEIKAWEKISLGGDKFELWPLYRPLPDKKIPANKDIIDAILDPETKGIIFGPGSFFTSLLPHLMVEGLPEALRKRRLKGDIPIVFAMNPTIDNETFNFSLQDILRFMDKKTGIKMDDMFTDMVVNKFDTTKIEQRRDINNNIAHMPAQWYVEKYQENPMIIDNLGLGYIRHLIDHYVFVAKTMHADPSVNSFEIFNDDGKLLKLMRNGKMEEQADLSLNEYLEAKIQELLDTLYQDVQLDIRTDPTASSKNAKKSHGPMTYTKEEIERIKSMYPRMNIYRDIFLGGVTYVPTRDPNEPPKKRIGFLDDYTSFLLGDLFGLDTLNDILTRQYDKIVADLKEKQEDLKTADEDTLIELVFYKKRPRLFSGFPADVDQEKQKKFIKYFGQLGLDGFTYIIKSYRMRQSFRVKVKDADRFPEQNCPLLIEKDSYGKMIVTKRGVSRSGEQISDEQKEQLEQVSNELIDRMNRDDVRKFNVLIATDPEIIKKMDNCVIEANLGKLISPDDPEETVIIHPEFFMIDDFNKKVELLYHAYGSHILNRERNEERASRDTNRFRVAPIALAFYRKAEGLKADFKHGQALSLLNQAQEKLTYANVSDRKQQSIIDSLLADVTVRIEELKEHPLDELKELKLQLVNEKNGKFIKSDKDSLGTNWIQAHKEGTWHANSQILVIDQKGRIWIQKRRDEKGRKDISVTGHILEGMGTYRQVALKRLTSEMGIAAPRRKALKELSDLKGKKKIGSVNYDQGKWCWYDEKNNIFYSFSKEQKNCEYTKLFLYTINDRELTAAEDSSIGVAMKRAMGFELYDLDELVDEVRNNPWNFASSALQFFHSDDNVEIIRREVHNAYLEELKKIERLLFPVSRAYLNDLKDSALKIIAGRNVWNGAAEKSRSLSPEKVKEQQQRAANEIEERYTRCLLLTTWKELSAIYNKTNRNKNKTIGPGEAREVLSLFHDVFGNIAETNHGRAVLHALLRLGAKMKADGRQLIFTLKNKALEGVTINENGRLVISEKTVKAVNTVRKGAIAADLDLIMAMRDKDTDPEIWRHINELRMMAVPFAVVSGNKYEKQYARALTDLLCPALQDGFLIYANGAGVKAVYDKIARKYVGDRKYSKALTKKQVANVVDEILTDTVFIWEEVIRAIREIPENRDHAMLKDTGSHRELSGLIEKRIKKNAGTVNRHIKKKYHVNIIEEITVALPKILGDLQNLLSTQFCSILAHYHADMLSEQGLLNEDDRAVLAEIDNGRRIFYNDTIAGKLESFIQNLQNRTETEINQDKASIKKIAYIRKAAQQLDRSVEETAVQKNKNWTGIDRRTGVDADDNDVVQVTIKPVYPTMKQMTSDDNSSREILGGIVQRLIKEANKQSKERKPLGILLGGSTSIDVMLASVNKASAVKDLLKTYDLTKTPGLLLAIDDEMDPSGVGFSFLTVAGITVMSGESRKGNVRRTYLPKDNKRVKVNDWFWSGDFNWEPELETTKNTFSLLETLYLKEMENVLKGEAKKPKSALQKLKNELKRLKQVNTKKPAQAQKPRQITTLSSL